jgi:hypothetical protein
MVIPAGIVIARGSQIDQAVQVALNLGQSALPKIVVRLTGLCVKNRTVHLDSAVPQTELNANSSGLQL